MVPKLALRLPLLALVLLALVVTACAPATPAAQPTSAVQPTAGAQPATAAPATYAAAASPTTAATATVAATATAAATATTAPASTVAATATVEPTAAPTGTAGDEDAPTGQAAFDFLMDVSKAQLDQQAWRATVTADDGESESTTVIEFVKPGSFRIVAGDDTEIIIIPDEGTFLKEGDVWQKSPIDMSGMMSEFLTQQNIEESMKQADVKELNYEGTETVDGRRMWVYTYSSTIKQGEIAVDSEVRVWLGADDELPYRFETVSTAGGTAATSVVEYEYDPDITIEAPEVAS